jgi:hypothetical protein
LSNDSRDTARGIGEIRFTPAAPRGREVQARPAPEVRSGRLTDDIRARGREQTRRRVTLRPTLDRQSKRANLAHDIIDNDHCADHFFVGTT